MYTTGICNPCSFAISKATATCGKKCPAVTRLILFAPCSCNWKKSSTRCSSVIFFPLWPLDILLFWQKLHPSEHPEKNTAPDPSFPEMQGSSHIWRATLSTMISVSVPQNPYWPAIRSAPQLRGQSRHSFIHGLILSVTCMRFYLL